MTLRLRLRRAAGRAAAALALLCLGAAVAGTVARLTTPAGVTVMDWPSDGPGFGGWSGLDVSADGLRFAAVTDSGTFTQGRLVREDGVLTGVDAPRPRWIGGILTGDEEKTEADAEGIDIGADGTISVSFERWNRVWRFTDLAEPAAERLPDAPFRALPINGGLEAVAHDAAGRLLTLPEARDDTAGDHPLYRFDGGQWTVIGSVAAMGMARPVGADVGPDGYLYVLERAFWGLGFSSRVRRFDLAHPGPRMRGTVVYSAPFGRHGNLEGIALWRDEAGGMRALMVTDDNHFRVQRQEFVEIPIPPLATAGRGD